METLHVTGSVRGDFDVSARTEEHQFTFDGTSDGSRFVHNPRDVGMLMNDGRRIILFDSKRNVYGVESTNPAPASASSEKAGPADRRGSTTSPPSTAATTTATATTTKSDNEADTKPDTTGPSTAPGATMPAASTAALQPSAVPGRPPADRVNEVVVDVLIDENPSLLLSLTSEPAKLLTSRCNTVRDGGVITIDGREYQSLVLQSDDDVRTIVLDPQTGLIRRMTVDLLPRLKTAGAKSAKQAEITVDYTSSKSGIAVAEGTFVWAPPAGAREFDLSPPEPESPAVDPADAKREPPSTQPIALPASQPVTTE